VHPLRWAIVVVGVAIAVVAERSVYDSGDLVVVVADGVVGMVLVVCGAVAWERRRESWSGPLMLLAGGAWFAGTIASFALFWHRGPLVHLHLSYPTGRMRRRSAIAAVGLAYLDALIVPLADSGVLTVVLAVLVALAAVDVFVRTSGPARWAGRPALAAAFAYSALLAAIGAQRLAGWDVDTAMVLVYDAVVATVVVVLLVDLLSGRWARAAVADLVISLGERRDLDTLRGQVAYALGDPSVQIGYWVAEQGGYVDDRGQPVELPGPDPKRPVTTIDDGADRVAILVHDAATVEDPRLLSEVAAAARLAVVNAKMQAAARVRVDDLAASRRRIVESADEQRRRLGRELSDGADRRLQRVQQMIDEAGDCATDPQRSALEAFASELRGTRVELREVAQGIRPPALDAGGLAAALPILADRAPVPVEITVDGGRLPPAVEAAVYFLSAEALANVAKHANATTATMSVAVHESVVAVSVVDDGVGGVDPSRGTGLRGLADRVEALGGRFAVGNSAAGGTIVTAKIPVDRAAVRTEG
jgi:signal transduction histidine kinase